MNLSYTFRTAYIMSARIFASYRRPAKDVASPALIYCDPVLSNHMHQQDSIIDVMTLQGPADDLTGTIKGQITTTQ